MSEPAWEWAAQAGGGSPGSGYGVVVDGEGNTCIAGTFFNLLVLGTNVLNCPAGCDGFFVAKYDPAGEAIWAQSAYAGNGAAYGFRLAVDGAGNVIWTGLFHGRIHIGRSSLNGEWGRDYIFIAKLDRDGNLLWVQQADGVSEDSDFQSAVDPTGNVYLSGAFPGKGQIGQHVLTSRGGHDVFLAKYDAGGAVLWVQQAGGEEFDESKGLCFDADGNVLWSRPGDPNHGPTYTLAVDAEDNLIVRSCFSGTTTLGTNVLTSGPTGSYFLAKYGADGAVLWARQGEGTGGYYRPESTRLLTDRAGNLYFKGIFTRSLVLDGMFVAGNNSESVVVAKYDSLGRPQWAKCVDIHRTDYAAPAGVGVAADGAVYVTGTVRWNSLYLAKLGPVELCFGPVVQCTSNGVFRLQLQGLRGRGPVVIEASTDLLNWVPICTNTVSGQTFEFTDPPCPSQPARFYRAVLP